LVVAQLIVQTWFNGLCRAVGSRRGGIATIVVIVAVLAGWTIFATRALTAQVDLGVDQAERIAGPVAAQLFALPALVALFGAISAPDRTHLGNLLAVLPISRRSRAAAPRYLAAALGVAVGGAWAFPLCWSFATSLPVPQAVLALLCCGMIALLGALSAQVCYGLVESVSRYVLGAASSTVRGVGGAMVALLVGWALLLGMPLQGRIESSGPLTLVAEPLTWAVDGAMQAAWGLLVLGGAVVVVGVALHAVDTVRVRRARPIGRRLLVPTPSPRTLVGLDVVQWLRFPMNATFLLFNSVILAVALYWGRRAGSVVWFELTALFLALASTVGVGSFGSTRPAHWIFSVAGRPRGWILPKLSGVVLIWSTLIVAMMAVFSMTTSWNESDGLRLLPTLALELLIGCVVGLIIPAGREQSFSTAMSEVVAVLVVLSVAVGIQSLPWMDSTVGMIATHAVGLGVALGLYIAVAREQSRKPLVGAS
jgi:hypothetical protein